MTTVIVVVLRKLAHDFQQVPLTQRHNVIRTHVPCNLHETFRDSILPRRAQRSSQRRNIQAGFHKSPARLKHGLVVVNEKPCIVIARKRRAQLLLHPCERGMPRNIHVQNIMPAIAWPMTKKNIHGYEVSEIHHKEIHCRNAVAMQIEKRLCRMAFEKTQRNHFSLNFVRSPGRIVFQAVRLELQTYIACSIIDEMCSTGTPK